MTDEEYLKQILALADELDRTGSAEPYDPDTYNDVIDRINKLHGVGYRSQRRRPWIVMILVWIGIAFLIGIVLLTTC